MRIRDYIRLGLTIGLLWVIWHHVHWSVATAITLMTVAFELISYYARALLK